MENEELKNVLGDLNSLLSNTNLDDVTAESAGYTEVKDGYYLSEVEKAELTVSKNSGNPQAFFQMKIVDDGYDVIINPDESVNLIRNANTINKRLFIYFPLTNEKNIKNFVRDMLKFEGEIPGEPLLEKECFTNSELLEEALSILVGQRLYINVNTTKGKDGKDSTWKNFISWKNAIELGLPE